MAKQDALLLIAGPKKPMGKPMGKGMGKVAAAKEMLAAIKAGDAEALAAAASNLVEMCGYGGGEEGEGEGEED